MKLFRMMHGAKTSKLVPLPPEDFWVWAQVNKDTGEVDMDSIRTSDYRLSSEQAGWEWRRFYLKDTLEPEKELLVCASCGEPKDNRPKGCVCNAWEWRDPDNIPPACDKFEGDAAMSACEKCEHDKECHQKQPEQKPISVKPSLILVPHQSTPMIRLETEGGKGIHLQLNEWNSLKKEMDDLILAAPELITKLLEDIQERNNRA